MEQTGLQWCDFRGDKDISVCNFFTGWLSAKASNSVKIKLKNKCLESDFLNSFYYIYRISIKVSRKLVSAWEEAGTVSKLQFRRVLEAAI